MTVELNHTIVAARDKWASAEFLTAILGLAPPEAWGPFVHVTVDHGVALEYMDVGDGGEVHANHYAFLVDDDTFDAAVVRLGAADVAHTADPYGEHPGEVNQLYGGRGVYFTDPGGHQLELMTTPYGDSTEFPAPTGRTTR